MGLWVLLWFELFFVGALHAQSAIICLCLSSWGLEAPHVLRLPILVTPSDDPVYLWKAGAGAKKLQAWMVLYGGEMTVFAPHCCTRGT